MNGMNEMMGQQMPMGDGMPAEMPQGPPPSTPPTDEANLAISLTPEQLDKIGTLCVEEFNADLASRTDFDKRRARWRKLFAGYRDPKTTPWKNCSNTHEPMLAQACLQFQARAFEALVQKDIAKCYSRDGAMIDAATRASEYMNWQLRYDMTEWEEEMDKLLLQLPMDGSAFKKTYYDTAKKRTASRLLSVDEFVVSYRCKVLDEATRKTQIIWKSINDIRIAQRDNLYLTPEDLTLSPQYEDVIQVMSETKEQIKKVDGSSEPEPQFTNKRFLIEQHRMLDYEYDPIKRTMTKATDGIEQPYIVVVDWQSQRVLRITTRLVPDDEQQKVVTLEQFTDYQFIPNPDSIYGYGFGQMLDHLNETADTILNQLIDAGHLNNIIGGVIAKRSGMKKGALELEMGKFNEVDIMAPDIKAAIYEFKFKPPSVVLFQLLDKLHSYVKEVTNAGEWMSGALPPSDTAATTMLAVIEQGLKVFSVIQKRCHRSLGKELRKIALLNKYNLDEHVYYIVQDSKSREFRTMNSGRMDFASNIEVIPVSDPNITSRAEKLIKAQQVLLEAKQNPLIMNNPPSLYLATRNYMVALEAPDIDGLVPEPQPPPPPPDLPPEEENGLFLKEQSAEPLPNQNHAGHYQSHIAFQESMWAEKLTPHGKKLMEAHLMATLSLMYLQEERLRAEIMKEGMRGRAAFGGGREGMAIIPGNTLTSPPLR